MSSAAVQQSTPQQYQQNTPGRDRYSSEPSAALLSSSPASRRSRNGADPSYTPNSTSTITPSRGQTAPNSNTNPMSTSTYDQYYPDSQGQQTSLPIRTSSQQPSNSTTAAAYDSRQYSSRSQLETSGYGSDGERDRRQSHRSPQQSPAQPGSGRSQRTRPAPVTSRSQGANDPSLPRENSAIINRIVVDDPQSDVARERARVAEAQPHSAGTEVTTFTPGGTGLGVVGDQGVPDSQRASTGQRSRQEHLKTAPHRKEVKFGDYFLGQTLGEGEFGKVKMGWKKDSSVQVAIKLIRKESLAGNATRLPKIYREISILKELEHPNIVRLHEFVETERHMGIILEYASGGELFDYILNHRYLKDPAAKRLFAQLVSGVGYLHRKGIVHRDLKLENLLLDRYKNIIITDFGFANTFSPGDELGTEIEHNINDKEFVKRQGLDAVGKDGMRRGDLMQTSCGSPCYAAPELVVSDGLYTGRKVDVWSCGVILYAMLAGYLPFDDDPANPEGDNINLLYKYIVATPLTFPEYVTPHARDLLRRILVPDPRRRADLFEVARHSWLSEYSHLVGFIGSTGKTEQDIAASAMGQDSEPILGRSASVREPSSRSPAATAATPASQKQPATEAEDKQRRDAKRKTVQVEYVAPKNATTRGGETSPTAPQSNIPIAGTGRTRAKPESQGPVEVTPTAGRQPIQRKDVPSQSMLPPPSRPSRDQARAASDSTSFSPQPPTTASRPNTRGNLPSRGNSYSQPVMATPTTENAQGRFSQPKTGPGYIISGSMPPSSAGQSPVIPESPQTFSQLQPANQQMPQSQGHKRSSTFGSITDRVLGRSNSRRKSQQGQDGVAPVEKRDRKYPPLSMNNQKAAHPLASPQLVDETQPRRSTDSRRSSFNFLRKNSSGPDVPSDSRRNSRRFSFLPNNFSMSSFSGKKESNSNDYFGDTNNRRESSRPGRPGSKGMAFGRGISRSPSQSTTNSTIPLYYEADREAQRAKRRSGVPQGAEKALPNMPSPSAEPGRQYGTPPPVQRRQFRDDGYGNNMLEPSTSRQEPPERFYTPNQDLDNVQSSSTPQDEQQYAPTSSGNYAAHQPSSGYRNDGYDASQGDLQRSQQQQQQSQLPRPSTQPDFSQNIRPQGRKFADGYNKGHEGSSSTARRVMDLFRRRGRDRGATAGGQ